MRFVGKILLSNFIKSTCLFCLMTATSFSLEREFTVNIRQNGKLKQARRTLTDLHDKDYLDGLYFQVNLGQSDSAARIADLNEEQLLRAATAYYYMSEARKFYLTLNLPGADLNKKAVLRIDVDREYSRTNHFSVRPRYNFVSTIIPSEPEWLADGITPWLLPETLFFLPKKVKVESNFSKTARLLNQREFKSTLMGQLLYSDVVSMTQGALYGNLNPEVHLTSMLFSLGLSELVPNSLELVGKATKSKQYLDAAVIPEIVVHEYGHHAMMHIHNPKVSTALGEGFPNYFAAKMLGLNKLDSRSKQNSRGFQAKRSTLKIPYSYDQDHRNSAIHGSFTFSVLSELDHELSKVREDLGLKVLVGSLAFLTADSTLKESLLNAVLRSIQNLNEPEQTKDALWFRAQNVMQRRML